MNTVTRMLLVPEEGFHDPANLVLSSNIPVDRKVRIFNQLKMMDIDKKKGQQNLQAIMNADLSSGQKKKLLESAFGIRKVDTGTQPDLENEADVTTSEFSTPRSDINTAANPLEFWSMTDTPTTPVGSKPDLSPLFERTSTPSTSKEVEKPEPLIQAPKLRFISRVSPQKSPVNSRQTLERALRNIPGLLKGENVVDTKGKVYPRSDIKKIVKYLTSEAGGAKPFGAQLVYEVIRDEKPELKKFIKNPLLTSKRLRWENIPTSKQRMLPRTAQEVSEESEDSTK